MNSGSVKEFSAILGAEKPNRKENMPSPPQYAQETLRRLEKAGYEAFFVGGCVRDLLLGRRPQDWDVCTSALPTQVMEVFPRALPTGLQHGTVTVRLGGGHVEVTTFRADGEYRDHRRPESVNFVRNLEEDLLRRDFTVNAMALSPDGKLTDLCGGREDLKNRIIRCVGDPCARFNEDALRMLRALRFSAQLGFEIEANTRDAICACAPLAAALAPERVREELEKILCSPRPETAARAVSCGLLDAYLRRPCTETDMRRLSRLPRTPQARWAGFCAILARSGAIEDEARFLRALRLPSATIRACASGSAAVREAPLESRLDWKRLLAERGEAAAFCAACAAEALSPSGALRTLKEILASGECCAISALAVNGDDLRARGLRGEEIGRMLRRLLGHVLEHPQDNTRGRLLSLSEQEI